MTPMTPVMMNLHHLNLAAACSYEHEATLHLPVQKM